VVPLKISRREPFWPVTTAARQKMWLPPALIVPSHIPHLGVLEGTSVIISGPGNAVLT